MCTHVIVSANLVKYIDNLEIDSKLGWTPSRPVKGNLKFPDHYALLLSLKNIPMMKTLTIPPRKEVVWNTRKKGGWEKYRSKTENNPVFIRAAESQEEDGSVVLKKVDKELTRIKYSCFGKIKLISKDKNVRELEKLQERKNNILKGSENSNVSVLNQNIVSLLKVIENDRIERDVKHLKNLKDKRGKAASVFGLRDKVLGKKKVCQEPVIIIEPTSGEEVNSPAEIKRVSLEYLVNLLKKKKPDEEFERVFQTRKELHDFRMSEEIEDDLDELPYTTFQKTLERVKKKNGKKYKFITDSGTSLKMVLFHIFSLIWKSEMIPDSWRESTVTQLKKNKSNQNDLNNFRHIHDRNIYSKLLGQMVIEEAKPHIYENMPMSQIACRPGHRASEHIFVIKSILAKVQAESKSLIWTNYDVSKMFDKEDIFFCLEKIYDCNVKGKLYRLLYQMNKELKVKVKTPVGLTPSAKSDPSLAQGSVEASIVSSAAIGKGVDDTFTERDDLVVYEGIPLPVQSFMDDVMKTNENCESAQTANDLLEEFMGKAGLELNIDKSSFVIMGSKKSCKKLQHL